MKKIIVTGASSGIGKEVCIQALNEGFEVIGIARDFSKCEINHPHFQTYLFDLSNLKNLPKFLKELTSKEGDIEGLVLNAGQGLFGYLEQLSCLEIQSLINLNLTSQIYLAKAFVPHMKKRGSGTLIFMGSEAALEGKAQGSVYCASKFAIRGFSQALRKECAKSGIQVSLINPGMVETPFFDSLHFTHGHHEENYCTPEDVANCVLMQLKVRPSLVFEEINLKPLKPQIAQKKESNALIHEPST
jgi:3-hydroxy acid dehydrogenase / malonic semialdehyde reductase